MCTGPRDPTETETACLSTSCGGTDWQWSAAGKELWVWVWHKSSWRRSPLTPLYRAARTYIGLGNRLLEGTTEPCAPGPRRKEQTPQETCLWVSGSLQPRSGLVVACCRGGGMDWSSTCLGSFEGSHHYLHYHHHSLAPGTWWLRR